MTIDGLIATLEQSADQLLPSDFSDHVPLQWRMAPSAPADPLAARPLPHWPLWRTEMWPRLRQGGGNWFYADVVWPEVLHGVALSGTRAGIFIWGYSPFRLWVDGEECWREDRAWHATGGIADPFPVPIKPGATVRLVCELAPTATFQGLPFHVCAHALACDAIGVQVAAVATQLRIACALQGGRPHAEEAARALDVAALERQAWGDFLASAAEAQRRLEPLRARAKALRIHAVGHAHIDLDWLWTSEDTVHCVRRDFTAAARLLRDRPELAFTASQVPTYAICREQDPAVFREIRALVADGRWEVAAGTWVEGDLAMADGEALVRQIRLAHAWCARELGATSRILWEPDAFSHPGNIPQIARLGGMDACFHWRCAPRGSGQARRWRGLDGSEILALSEGYTATLHPAVLGSRMLAAMAQGQDRALHVWGIGDHGGGLPRRWLELLDRVRDAPCLPTIAFGSAGSFADGVDRERLPVQDREEEPLFPGCFTSHARIKRLNRAAEQSLLAAGAALALAGRPPGPALDELWRVVCFGQFHDILCGCNAPQPAADAERRLAGAIAAADALRDEALASVLPQEASAFTVVNLVAHPITAPVLLPGAGMDGLVDADGRTVPIQRWDGGTMAMMRLLPAIGARSVRSAPSTDGVAVSVAEIAEGWRVVTAHAELVIDRASGAVMSWRRARDGRELVPCGCQRVSAMPQGLRRDQALGVPWLIEEEPADAWHARTSVAERPLVSDALVTLVDAGPVAARFLVTRTVGASPLTMELTVWRDLPRIDWRVRVDWRERTDARRTPSLKLGFHLSLSAARIRRSSPFALSACPADGSERSTQQVCTLVGDEGGVALLNRGNYGFDALGSRMRASLVRGFAGPDPDGDVGSHVAELALVDLGAEPDESAACVQGLAMNRPPIVVAGRTARAAIPVPAIEAEQAMVTAVERRSDGAWEIRAVAMAGRPGLLRVAMTGGIAAAAARDFLDRPHGEQPLVEGDALRMGIPPWRIITLWVMPRSASA